VIGVVNSKTMRYDDCLLRISVEVIEKSRYNNSEIKKHLHSDLKINSETVRNQLEQEKIMIRRNLRFM
jgi:hypothetical protein